MNKILVPRLSLKGICKSYPPVLANDRVDLSVMQGEIHAVLGENGAGKSTLMKIIYGLIRCDAGQMYWHGEPVEVHSPAQARSLGIGMVFQHFLLFESLSVVENVALSLTGERYDLKALARRLVALGERYEMPVEPNRPVYTLAAGDRQRVEMIRCLLQSPSLLILDEPTSALTPQASQKLFEVLRRFAAEGRSVLYISHKLDEVQALCDSATILQYGRVSATCKLSEETPLSLARLMVGHEPPKYGRKEGYAAEVSSAAVLRVSGLSCRLNEVFSVDLHDIQLEVRAGEIVGIAGIEGNGQRELLQVISGETPSQKQDSVEIGGVGVGQMTPRQRRQLGFCFIPEDRLGRAAVASMSLSDNVLLTLRTQHTLKYGLINTTSVNADTDACIEAFQVQCSGRKARADSLSGGNLQKFIVGREIWQRPKVLVVAQPSWGVDVKAANLIKQSLIKLRNEGAAILLVSRELDELFDLCDRLAVIARGRISPLKKVSEVDAETLGLWMSGIWPDGKVAHQAAAAGRCV